MNRGNAFPLIASALAGLLVCLAISYITGKREAFDSSLYFSAGLPLMCLLIFIISYFFPEKPWRWVLSMATERRAARL